MLNVGTCLGPYEITAPLGVGGMGEVYRATDTNLKRQVAIKVLPASVADDPERLARFQREAEVLAALNHPNIAHIHGLHKADATIALVMELVEGPTLADRIAGAIPIDEALPIAKQIAEALEAAHEHGIIHRDLKPANIKVRDDGTVKVLDFGLAKAMAGADSSSGGVTMSPTLSLQATQAGLILGTAAYMSPEQAAGKPVDKRADVWSFGVVLWEVLTGAQLFSGETISHTLADVLRADIDFSKLPAETPHAICELLRRCLDRDVKRRLRDIGEARIAIDRAIANPQAGAITAAGGGADVGRIAWRRRAAPAAVGAIVAALAVAALAWFLRPSAATAPVTRFAIALPEAQQFTNTGRQFLGISPDGSQIAFFANRQIYLRAMTSSEAKPIAGSQVPTGLTNLTFSPDGQSIAFWMAGDNVLKRIAVTGGPAVRLCALGTNPFGMSWGVDGIVFGVPGQGIMRVGENGGTPELVVSVSNEEIAYGPQMLPDHMNVMFAVRKRAGQPWDDAEIVLQRIGSKERQILIRGGSDARYVPTGHILYAIGGTVFAVRFDAGRMRMVGRPVPVIEGVRRAPGATSDGGAGTAVFAVSTSGTLAYIPGPVGTSLAPRELVSFDRRGGFVPLKLPRSSYAYPRIAPDGKQLAYETDEGGEAIIWVYDLSGVSSPRRLTFGGRNQFPVWSGDSQWIAFQSDREGDAAIFRQRADGSSGTVERLTKADRGTSHIPESWSRDAKTISYTIASGPTCELALYSIVERKTTPLPNLQSVNGFNSALSPDGRWIAYSWRQSGASAGRALTGVSIQVQPLPPTGSRFEFGRDASGHHPLWSPDGTELFYFPGAGALTSITVTTQPVFAVSDPVTVNATFVANTLNPLTPTNYDITPDGQHFIAAVEQTTVAALIQVVLNWFEELKRLVPSK